MVKKRRKRSSPFLRLIQKLTQEKSTLSNLLKASKDLRVSLKKEEQLAEKVEMTNWEASKMIKARDFLHL